jgi:hypothetical protein
MKKCLTLGIILLFIGTCIIPLGTSEQTHRKHIITVDDEPGDADYTSINDSISHSNPGDIIEIYSGTYYEEGITVDCNNISIIGISEELGQGNDTGKPFIQGNGNETVFNVAASHVFIANLRIENMLSGSKWVSGLYIGIGEIADFNNITITNTSVRNCTRAGIVCCVDGRDIVITDNDVQNCMTTGMMVSTVSGYPKCILCSNNTITDCSYGIDTACNHVQFSDNIIRRCSLGINLFQGQSNQILSNDFEDCEVAIYLNRALGTTISKNNFINYSKNGMWWERLQWSYVLWGEKNIWTENYWSTWKELSPKPIRGTYIFWIFIPPIFSLEFPVNWLDFDRHPAQEPYDITRMT